MKQNFKKIDPLTANKIMYQDSMLPSSRTELLALCKGRGMKGYSSKKKDELIQLLSGTTEQLDVVKPFLKWVGGKTQILTDVLSAFPKEISNYHEPFLGGGSVLLGLLSYVKANKIKLSGTVYASDINANVINLFKNIQLNPQGFIDEVKKITDEYTQITGTAVNRKAKNKEEALTSQESYYYWIRSEFNALTERTTLRASAMCLFLNKMCFRGLYREGPDGFNVPFEKIQKNQTVLDEEHIRKVSELIKGVVFTAQTFEKSLEVVKPSDFVYLDPPYAPETDTSFVGYTAEGYEEHDRLFNQIKNKDVKFVLSNADVKIVRDAFPVPKYQTKVVEARRAINSKNPDAKTNEVLISN